MDGLTDPIQDSDRHEAYMTQMEDEDPVGNSLSLSLSIPSNPWTPMAFSPHPGHLSPVTGDE